MKLREVLNESKLENIPFEKIVSFPEVFWKCKKSEIEALINSIKSYKIRESFSKIKESILENEKINGFIVFSKKTAICLNNGKFYSVGPIGKFTPKNFFETFIYMSISGNLYKSLAKELGASPLTIKDMETVNSLAKRGGEEGFFNDIEIKMFDSSTYIIYLKGFYPSFKDNDKSSYEKLDIKKDKDRIKIFRDIIRLRAKYS